MIVQNAHDINITFLLWGCMPIFFWFILSIVLLHLPVNIITLNKLNVKTIETFLPLRLMNRHTNHRTSRYICTNAGLFISGHLETLIWWLPVIMTFPFILTVNRFPSYDNWYASFSLPLHNHTVHDGQQFILPWWSTGFFILIIIVHFTMVVNWSRYPNNHTVHFYFNTQTSIWCLWLCVTQKTYGPFYYNIYMMISLFTPIPICSHLPLFPQQPYGPFSPKSHMAPFTPRAIWPLFLSPFYITAIWPLNVLKLCHCYVMVWQVCSLQSWKLLICIKCLWCVTHPLYHDIHFIPVIPTNS